MPAYVPDVGDVVRLNFDPRTGHEQAGHRPALVMTPARYNRKTGLMIVCPMTSRIKNYVFEVVVSRAPPRAVLADQVRNVDWRARRAVLKGTIAPEALADVKARIQALLQLR